MTRPDVPEKDRLAEAVVRSLCEGAGTSDGAAAIVKPISLDVPVGNLSHEDLGVKRILQIRIENCAVRYIQAAPPNVRFGSKADIEAHQADVRFTPKADIRRRKWHVRFVP